MIIQGLKAKIHQLLRLPKISRTLGPLSTRIGLSTFGDPLMPRSSPTVLDVAAYILDKMGEAISTFKLQKLVFYSQAWSLVREEEALFPEEIQAWANGPVVPALFEKHRTIRKVSSGFFPDANPNFLSEEQKETIDKVIDLYGDKDTQWLVSLTHMEDPWKDARARAGLKDLEVGTEEITQEAIKSYYSSI